MRRDGVHELGRRYGKDARIWGWLSLPQAVPRVWSWMTVGADPGVRICDAGDATQLERGLRQRRGAHTGTSKVRSASLSEVF